MIGFQWLEIEELKKDEEHGRERTNDAKDHELDYKILQSSAQEEKYIHENETKWWHHQLEKDWKKIAEENEKWNSEKRMKNSEDIEDEIQKKKKKGFLHFLD